MSRLTIGCVQLCAGRDLARNVDAASELIREAVAAGADFVATPEMTSLMELGSRALFSQITTEKDDVALARFRELAAELGCWLLIGSLAVRVADDKAANRSFLVAPDGGIAARYDKIHMFDVTLSDTESYRESKTYAPGDRAVVADLPWGRLGMSVCYDLRFPGLYRSLARQGATILAVPSAFTRPTGEAHWHTLLRARAIENAAFVVAPAQSGEHENGRKTYGHSLVVSPWGEVLADGGTETGVTLAQIDPGEVLAARSRIPSLDHDRPFEVAGATGQPDSLRAVS